MPLSYEWRYFEYNHKWRLIVSNGRMSCEWFVSPQAIPTDADRARVETEFGKVFASSLFTQDDDDDL
jgi:hypothetical protein